MMRVLSAQKDAVKISNLLDCIRLTKAGEASATAKTNEALDKNKHLEVEKAKLKRDRDSAEEEYVGSFMHYYVPTSFASARAILPLVLW